MRQIGDSPTTLDCERVSDHHLVNLPDRKNALPCKLRGSRSGRRSCIFPHPQKVRRPILQVPANSRGKFFAKRRAGTVAQWAAVEFPEKGMQERVALSRQSERPGGAAVCFEMNSDSTDAALSKLTIQVIHLELTNAMRGVIQDKFAPLLRHNEYIVRINVRLHQDQTMGTEHHYTATGQIEIAGPDLIASAEGKEAYDVIDQLVEKLDRQLERRHDRRKDRRNHPHAPEIEAPLPKVE